jgi:hypothetical protein
MLSVKFSLLIQYVTVICFFLKRIESVNDSLLIRPFLDMYNMSKLTLII